MDSKVFAISKEIMEGPGVQLFDHIAKCLADFVQEKGLKGSCLPLGFTFSFPCKQEGLAIGKLTNWTKGFKCAGVEGKDVVLLLKEALARRGDVNIEVSHSQVLSSLIKCQGVRNPQRHNWLSDVVRVEGQQVQDRVDHRDRHQRLLPRRHRQRGALGRRQW